nr:hypothetical protein [Desulfoscipio geothermicus]
MSGYQQIVTGNSEIVLAGGTESMSNARYGLASLCVGGGMGVALIVEREVDYCAT